MGVFFFTDHLPTATLAHYLAVVGSFFSALPGVAFSPKEATRFFYKKRKESNSLWLLICEVRTRYIQYICILRSFGYHECLFVGCGAFTYAGDGEEGGARSGVGHDLFFLVGSENGPGVVIIDIGAHPRGS